MGKITAVEWFWIHLPDNVSKEYFILFQQAKQMEKEQIMNAWRNGDNDSIYDFKELDELALKYYNEQYGSNNQI